MIAVIRRLTLAPLGEAELIYLGFEPSTYLGMCSVSPVRRIENGCVAYLAMVVDTRDVALRIEDILVAQEFPNVFPAELPVKRLELTGDRLCHRLSPRHCTYFSSAVSHGVRRAERAKDLAR